MSNAGEIPVRRIYLPELDILRCCCFLSIFLHHGIPRGSGGLAGALVDAGAFAMPVFFLLSSFLITQLLLRERERTATVHVKAFYLRRILRIWPLYFVFIAVCVAMGHLHGKGFQPITGRMAAYFVFLSGNWFLYFFGVPANPINVLWSISLEEQFYLVWPWFARLGGTRAILILASTLLPASYLALFFLSSHGVNPGTGLWTNTFVQMQFFAIGALIALWIDARPPRILPARRVGLVLLASASWLTAAWWCGIKRDDPSISPAHACLGYFLIAIGSIAVFLTFYGLAPGSGPVARAFLYLGKISFGLYTFHFLALELAYSFVKRAAPGLPFVPAADILGFIATLCFAACSYRLLETPALRLKEKFTFVHSRPI